MKKILLTGATGFLGRKLVKQIIDTSDFNVVAIALNESRLMQSLIIERIETLDRIEFCSHEDFFQGALNFEDVYGAVHLAFARREKAAEDIASSLVFASNVFRILSEANIERVINVSSQGVYGNVERIRTESMMPAPTNHYTMAKYASEIIFNTYFENSLTRNFTNIRMDLVAQSQNILRALCKQSKEGILYLKGGEQRFSFIDASDAVSGILAMLFSPEGWDKTYNLGWNCRRFKLTEVAELVADSAEKLGYRRPKIILDKQDISLWSGMDTIKFTKHTGWIPKIDALTMIENIFEVISDEQQQ